MRRIVLAIALLAFAGSAFAQRIDELNRRVQLFPPNEHAAGAPGLAGPFGGGPVNLLINHGGGVIANANVVAIYWGAEWGSGGASATIAGDMDAFFRNFGNSGEYKTVMEYGVNSGLGAGSWFDSSQPPTNVSDAAIQAEVIKYFTSNNVAPVPNTIYEVFLPSTSYSSYGSSTSCGGPNLKYCAYHSNFAYANTDVKYASMPYPGCSGCQSSGFTVSNNFQHFACHETREAVTDPDGTTWYDKRGNEADDKCAWSPAPFTDGPYGYQYEWSNAAGGCIKTK